MSKGGHWALCVLFVLSLAAGSALGNSIAYYTTEYDTDWTSAGVCGVRDLGTGTIALAGVSGTVTKAYLYWHGPTNSSDPTVNANVSVNGNSVTGTNIGFSADNNWGYQNSQAYCADVTLLVSGNGNYVVSNLINGSVANINGVSLVVFHDDGDSTNNRDVVMFHGNDSNEENVFDTAGWTATLNGINYSGGSASALFGVSDGQHFSTPDDPGVLINGNLLFPPGNDFDGVSVPNAGGGVPNGGLWDLKTFDITSFLSPGVNNLTLQTQPNVVQDYLSLVHLDIDLPAGAAPPPIPEPFTAISLMLGLAVAGRTALRRRRAV